MNANGEFVSASELTVQTMNPQYDVSSDEALELFHILGIKEEIEDPIDVDVDITSFGEQLGLSEEEQRQALLEFAKRKKSEEYEDDLDFSCDYEEADDT